MFETKLKPSKILTTFSDLLKNANDNSLQRVVSLIGEAIEDQPMDLTSKVENFVRSFGLMEFIGCTKLIFVMRKYQQRVTFFNQLKTRMINAREEEEGNSANDSDPEGDKSVYSFERTNAMLSAPYTQGLPTEQDFSSTDKKASDPRHGVLDDFQKDDFQDKSAMNLGAMSNYDLSQIMNSNVNKCLDDSDYKEHHPNTVHSASFLWKVFHYLEKKIHRDNQHLKYIALISIKSLELETTVVVNQMPGLKKKKNARQESLKRMCLILSGCIRERESRAIATWHEALLNQKFLEISYQKMIYQISALMQNKKEQQMKKGFNDIRRYARWIMQEDERLNTENHNRNKSRDIYVVIVEFLKRCVLKRYMAGYSEIKRIYTGEEDAKLRIDKLEKKASIMILENFLDRLYKKRLQQGIDNMQNYTEQMLLDNPVRVAWCDFAKQIRIKFNEVNFRCLRYHWFQRFKLFYSDRYRNGMRKLIEF